MNFKNDRKYFWTMHARRKIRQYNLSPGLIKRILRNPDRVEEGIAQKTIAVMKDKSTKSQEREVWVMYQLLKSQRKKIISAWIYPGKTKPGKEIFIPDEVLLELERIRKKNKDE